MECSLDFAKRAPLFADSRSIRSFLSYDTLRGLLHQALMRRERLLCLQNIAVAHVSPTHPEDDVFRHVSRVIGNAFQTA
jgi:hypothetical protein